MNRQQMVVGYQYVYDLYYRVRQACLTYDVYQLDFLDWIKAGLAFNALGVRDISRRPSYFGRLYKAVISDIYSISESDWREAVLKYYEDIFQLYQDHLLAQLQIASRRKGGDFTSPKELLIVPSFEKLPEIMTILQREVVVIDEYVCKNTDELLQVASTVYLTEDSLLFKGMSLMFDYGVKRYKDGIALEVK